MTIPPRFLDELRSRANLSDVIGKRVKLTRAGREFKACCPFHNEKSPSFYVNDDKQFFHCFGCGAHGSVIDFVMRHDNQSFPEAVENLAAQFGMQVPKSSPEEIEKASRAKTLYTMLDDATKWMEEQLRHPSNKSAYEYIKERGLNDETLTAFRVGYAPLDMQSLRKHLSLSGYTDDQMIEGGIIKVSDKGKDPYVFFRERVMFPVPDRRGRVVAFGGRVLPDHLRSPSFGDYTPAKYINSPDSSFFHKGTMLYGEPHARQAANDGQSVLVVEGYLDVIACWMNGYKGAVAPMGTALTEDQILVLWKMIPDESKIPILCFDGDNAGRRAASRACERLLPMIKPNHSAKIAFLPEGEDPDSLMRTKGKEAFRAVLDNAMNLVDFYYYDETHGKIFDTPESRAGLSQKLEDIAARITDRTVQHYYREAFRAKTRAAFSGTSSQKQPWQPQYVAKRAGGTGWKYGSKPEPVALSPLKRPVFAKGNLYEMAFLACVINNPEIGLDVEEMLGGLVFSENGLDRVRQAVLSTLTQKPELDRDDLKTHLLNSGFERELGLLLSENIYVHASFARPVLESHEALEGWKEAWKMMELQDVNKDIAQAQRALRDDFSEENENRLAAIRESRKGSDV